MVAMKATAAMKSWEKAKGIYKQWMHRSGLVRRIVRWTIPAVIVVLAISSILYFVSIPRFQVVPSEITAKIFEGSAVIDKFAADAKTGTFTITTRNGSEWLSDLDSETAKADAYAKGINRITMLSQMVIRYVDADNRTYIATSYANALDNGKKSLGMTGSGGSYRAEYSFVTGKAAEGLDITIPVTYEIYDGSLRVCVITSEIDENEEYKLLDITLLPYLGAASEEEEGYLLIPDGSGALIPFGIGSAGAAEWSQNIYGRDAALKTKTMNEVNETVRLPVFGIKKKDSAMLAIIDSGEALCSVSAQTEGMSSSWNTACFTYRYREYDTITLNEMGWNERNIPSVSKTPNSGQPFIVQYFFLEGEDADYAGMARLHREYLMNKENIRKAKVPDLVPLYLDINMSVRRIRPVLGLPTEVVEPLTTYEELTGILDSFKALGVDSLVVRMDGWMDGGIYYKTPGQVSYEKVLGGKAGFNAMAAWAAENPEIKILPSAEFINGYRNGNGFISLFQGNRDITGALSLQNEFLSSTGTKNLRKASWNLITPSYSIGMLMKYLESFGRLADKGISGIALDGYGDIVYSDRYESVLNGIVSRTPVDRQTAVDIWQQGMRAARATGGELLVTGGNSYAISCADYIMGIPMQSSNYKITTVDVPYYQILTTGLVRTTSSPANFSKDIDAFYLKCLEYGTYPMYSLFAAESSLVKNTALKNLYNGQYTLWMEKAADKYLEYKDVYRMVAGAFIDDHQTLEDGRKQTTYDNGIIITVDYSTGSFEVTEPGVNRN
ncbi:MAG: DUF5696 domain-containing protein [Saccharofermentanales bacterium]